MTNANQKGGKLIGGAATGLSSPRGLAIDGQGRLLAANTSGNSVTIFAAAANGNVAPAVTIAGTATGLNTPAAVAVDAAGNLYDANGQPVAAAASAPAAPPPSVPMSQ